MSIKAINWALSLINLPIGHKCVLFVLANCANEKGECWPSFDEICNKSSGARATVSKYLSYMESNNILKVIKRRNQKGYKQSNMYALNLSLSSTVILRDYDDKLGKVNRPLVQPLNQGLSSTLEPRKSNPLVQSSESLSSIQKIPKFNPCTKDTLYTNHHKDKPSLEPSIYPPSPLRESGGGKNSENPAIVLDEKTKILKADVLKVFEHWKSVMASRAKIIPESLIKKRLKIYSVSDLCKAIDGCLHDDWLMGRDEKTNGKKFNTLEYILRDKHLDMLIEYADNPPLPKFQKVELTKNQKLILENEAVAKRWLEKTTEKKND